MAKEKSQNGRKRYWKQLRDIVEEKNVSYAEAKKIWREKYKQVKEAGKGIPSHTITKEFAEKCIKCPYCQELLLENEDAYCCPHCTTNYHTECIFEFKKCATMGCRKPISKSSTPVIIQPKKISISSVTIKPQPAYNQSSRHQQGNESRLLWETLFEEAVPLSISIIGVFILLIAAWKYFGG